MKKFLLSVMCLAALLLSTASVSAQYALNTTSLNGGTNNLAATSTNSSVGVVIAVNYGSAVAINPSFKLTGSGTSAVTFIFDHSIDNSTWETAKHSIAVTAAGTSVVNVTTNLTLGAVGYLRLNEIRNPNANAITNLTVKFATKRGI